MRAPMDKIKFYKDAKSPTELLDKLINRGMIIHDMSFAQNMLSKINYYRLSGYWFKFQNKWLKTIPIPPNATEEEIAKLNNQFIKAVSFENIIDIYRFDSKLRSLCIDALEKVEIAFGSILCNHMCQKYGGYWFLDKKNINEISKPTKNGLKVVFNYSMFIEDIEDLLRKNQRTQCIQDFYKKYSDKYPPYWILTQLITFGTLSKIYVSLPPCDKKEIAKSLGVNDEILAKTFQLFAYIRNICAHYARLWDNENSVIPPNIKLNPLERNSIYNYNFHKNGKNNNTFFPIFYLISFYLHVLYPESKWCSLVSNKIKEYKKSTKDLISFKEMGFLDEWEKLPLFKEMLKNSL